MFLENQSKSNIFLFSKMNQTAPFRQAQFLQLCPLHRTAADAYRADTGSASACASPSIF